MPKAQQLISIQPLTETAAQEQAPFPRSLMILTHSSDPTGQETSLEANISISIESVESGPISRFPMTVSSLHQDNRPRHAAMTMFFTSTPPPDDHVTSQIELINGVGCHFPSNLPSRASSLTLGSDCPSGAPSTPRRGSTSQESGCSDDDNDLTPTMGVRDTVFTSAGDGATPQRVPFRSGLFGLDPLTPSPSPRTKSKRVSSPPSTPRPIKRSRSQDRQDQLEYFRELGTQQAFHNAKRLTTKLRRSASPSGENPESSKYSDPFVSISPSQIDHLSSSFRKSSSRRFELLIDTDTQSAPAKQVSQQAEFAIEIEWFSEDQIEELLAGLLSSFREFYVRPEDTDDQVSTCDPESAKIARSIFKAIFKSRLSSPEDEALLLQEEDEDVLNMFMIWIREMNIPSGVRIETATDIVDRLIQLTVEPGTLGMNESWPFVQKIT
ncbi:hypothetical protein B0H63DRAFT_18695 [Podospora didyma]|uniref:Uncharacterized protein n=1 Tax=Podospora didyma TaxID=330526 RepID=A0AAE0P4Y3_9PEZI|nr:hypothetical protein B0H63DRAFT_18695 [Podospora didyma]